ncbi:hypothetical protein NDU88_002781 [Pleurodeles waltl]|uniref:Uncharacterized protein n=1 Tax=Pleurodeles waltl TaxID=8319 RepID=A0AAV7W510_PLEWA|nr:hypothetical protein NDU88_002781 [Pleurodeles waltl]
MFESPRGTPTRIAATRMEGHADVKRRRQPLGNLEKKERGRGGDAGENGDAGGDGDIAGADAKGEGSKRVGANRREEMSEDPGDVGRRCNEAGPKHVSQGAVVRNGEHLEGRGYTKYMTACAVNSQG